MSVFFKDVKYVKNVGPNRVKLLNKLNVFTLEDLITYYPRQYEDRSKAKPIIEAINGEDVLIEAVVVSKMSEIRTGRLTIYKLIVRDDSSDCLITWYNQSYLKNKFIVGEKYKFFGKIKKTFGTPEMQSPVFDSENTFNNTGKIVPIYPLTYNLSQNVIRKIIENAFSEAEKEIVENLPEYLIKEYNLLNKKDALKQIHFPKDFNSFNNARKRLAFEELLVTQLVLLSLKNKYNIEDDGIMFNKDIHISDLINKLPFKLTNAQIKVLEEIDLDLECNKITNRLLQGDVGSGKTIVSIIAAYKAVKSKYQVAVMVPTAILASQHLESYKSILDKEDINIEILTSGMTKKNKEEILNKLSNGKIDILIGTHALLEENVIFNNLGLVITDEQHRFGVRQRGILNNKGKNPNVIVMTATPIPRTLALILYGDLDISIIDELPPNRQKIDTYAVTKELEDRINIFIKKEIDKKRQAYIVCPLVEENEEISAQSVEKLVEKYKNNIFSNYRVEYLHGKMKPKEKENVMLEFKNGNIDILISTTVIEVGVNVPNASIMIIENAERFGLAQLHQLRGRVGRGSEKSYCVLKYQGKSDIIKQRMKIMQETNDGFKISEKDLELRGSGDFFGTKQHGIPEFKIANLFEDMELLKQAQSVAIKITNNDRYLEKDENKRLKDIVSSKTFCQVSL